MAELNKLGAVCKDVLPQHLRPVSGRQDDLERGTKVDDQR